MSTRDLIKIFFTFFVVFIFYLLIGSIIPCLFNKNISKKTKDEFLKTKFSNSSTNSVDNAFVVETPEDALSMRMELVNNSKKTLDIVTYKIADSSSTRAFLGEVVNAADRGVKVRLLLDGKSYFYGDSGKFLNAMNEHKNIECRIYNPVNLLKPWDLQFLMHDKIILVDNEYLLLGGRNIDERHFAPKSFDGPITHDRETFVYNVNKSTENNQSAVLQVLNYVDSLWDYEKTENITKKGKKENQKALLEEVSIFEKENPKFYKNTLNDFIDKTVPASKITLIHNPIEAKMKEPVVGYILQQLSLQADESVVFQTPYSTGNKELLNTMDKVGRNVDFSMQTNSPASTPNLAAFSNYYANRKKFLNTNATIYEYQSEDSIHGKSMVIDDKIAIIGSFNMDDRSFYLDTETMLVIESPELSNSLSSHIKDLNKKSLVVGKNNEYISSDLVEKAEVSNLKIFLLWTVYILLRPFQFLI